MPDLVINPTANADDGCWSVTEGYEFFDSTKIDLGNDDNWFLVNGFIRFPNVTIPAGSIISAAILRFTGSTGRDVDTVNLNIHFNDVDNAAAPTTYAGAEALALTAAVAWNALPDWLQNVEYDSPDLTTILQAIIDRPGWASGQAVMALVRNNSSSDTAYRSARPFEYGGGTMAVDLRITYTPGYKVSAVPFEAIASGEFWFATVMAAPFEAATSIDLGIEITNSGGLAKTLPLLTCVAVAGPLKNGNLACSLPIFTCEADGTVRSGGLEQDLPMFTIVATGQGGSVGRLAVSLPKLQISASGSCSPEGVVGDLGVSLPALTISASGLCGQVGSLDQLLPLFTISASGYTQGVGNADMDLPMFYIYASGHQTEVLPEYLVLAMNPKNMAVSEYDWSGFNSFAYFNGQYLGAKAGTIHVLGGDDDAGSIIESEIELGQIAVDSAKPRDVYVLGRASGMMALTVMADEDTEKEVKIAYMLETLNLDRAKIPRGIQPTYFSLKLENRNGSDFDIDEIQVWGEGIKRGGR